MLHSWILQKSTHAHLPRVNRIHVAQDGEPNPRRHADEQPRGLPSAGSLHGTGAENAPGVYRTPTQGTQAQGFRPGTLPCRLGGALRQPDPRLAVQGAQGLVNRISGQTRH